MVPANIIAVLAHLNNNPYTPNESQQANQLPPSRHPAHNASSSQPTISPTTTTRPGKRCAPRGGTRFQLGNRKSRRTHWCSSEHTRVDLALVGGNTINEKRSSVILYSLYPYRPGCRLVPTAAPHPRVHCRPRSLVHRPVQCCSCVRMCSPVRAGAAALHHPVTGGEAAAAVTFTSARVAQGRTARGLLSSQGCPPPNSGWMFSSAEDAWRVDDSGSRVVSGYIWAFGWREIWLDFAEMGRRSSRGCCWFGFCLEDLGTVGKISLSVCSVQNRIISFSLRRIVHGERMVLIDEWHVKIVFWLQLKVSSTFILEEFILENVTLLSRQ